MRLHRSRGAASLLAALGALAAAALGSGCASCNGARPGRDGGRDADADAETDADGPAADGDVDADGDAEQDSDLPPGCEPLELVEMPRTREGRDCGPGCRQVTFADAVFRYRYDVSGQYLAYQGGDLSRRALHVVNLNSGVESRFDSCSEGSDTAICTVPGIDDGVLAYAGGSRATDSLMFLWRYRVGDSFRCSVATRTVADRGGMMDVDVHGDLVAWYDSAVAPAGLYAMPLAGGEVISLTRNECVCYGAPHLWGRQVVYENWSEGPRDIHIVDVDTLEDRALTHSLVQQFDPAFDGRWVVWVDSRNDPSEGDPYNHRINPDIYGLELPDGPERAICDHPAAQLWPDVHDGLVAWMDFRNSETPNDGQNDRADTDIYLYDLRTGLEHQVTSGPPRESEPRIWGRKLYYVAPDATGADAVFEVDLVERLGIEP